MRQAASDAGRIVVQATESIAQAIQRARPGTTIVVEPGEYRETLTLKSQVRLVSSVPRAAILRLPGAASERAAAIVAMGVSDAALDGFRIVGDAATPLGIGVLTADSELSISNVEITGATRVALDIGKGSRVRVVAADIADNPGSALTVRAGATALVSHSVFRRNSSTAGAPTTVVVEDQGVADLTNNVFVGGSPSILTGSSEARAAFGRSNWFIDARPPAATRPTPRGPANPAVRR